MEAQLNFNYITNDYIENFNSTGTTTHSTFGTENKWTDAEINRLIQIITRPMFLVIGTGGNGLTVYIMRRSSLKDVSSCFYMCLLALADSSK